MLCKREFHIHAVDSPMMVGMVRTIVKDVKIFMTLFKLFETIAEKVLLMLSTNFSCILVVFSPCSSSIKISLKWQMFFWMIKNFSAI